MSPLGDRDKEQGEGNQQVVQISIAALLQWIPIWLAFVGMFLSAANVYANVMTKIGSMETRLNLFSEVLGEVKDEVNDSRQDRRDNKQDDTVRDGNK